MRDADFSDDAIYGQRSALAAQLREHVVKESDRLAEQVFRAKLAHGEIRFDLEASDRNHRMRKSYEILVAENDGPAKGVFRLVFDREGFPDAEAPISRLKGAYNAPRA